MTARFRWRSRPGSAAAPNNVGRDCRHRRIYDKSRSRLPSLRLTRIVDLSQWETESMKLLLGSLALAVVLASPVFAATNDDAKWVAKCVSDNAGAKNVTVEIIASYCTCM